MSEDQHADARDRKRVKRRYGHTTTNPGMRIVMRELAQKDKDAHRADQTAGVTPGKRSRTVRIVKRRRKRGR